MNYNEYLNRKFQVPYKYIINNNKQVLYYFGEEHSFDPNHKQWVEFNKFWHDFTAETVNKKRVVFVEAGLPTPMQSETEAIKDAGGTGLVVYLANKFKIEVFNPEPSRKYEADMLNKVFSRDEIEYYYFARIVSQWHRTSKNNFNEYINSYLQRDKRILGWKNFKFTYEHMAEVHLKIFNSNIDVMDSIFFKKITSPVELTTTINKVCRLSGEIRDLYIVDQVKNYWEMGYSIYVEYGFGHAVIQEELLKEVLK